MPLLSPARQLFRRLSRSPGFTAVSLLTLALGVAANVAVFSVVQGVLLKPLDYPEPERLVGLWHEAPGLGFDEVNQSPALHFTYRDQGTVFADVGLWDQGQVSITGLDEPEKVDVMRVNDGTLPILGARPVLGRVFALEDDLPNAPETVILSHAYWQQRYAGDASILGTSTRINGVPHEIIGVMPPGFRVVDHSVSVYLPFQLDRAETRMGNFSYRGLARLKPGVTLEQANAEVARLIPIATEIYPGGLSLQNLQEAGFGPQVRPLEIDVIGDVGNTLWVLMGTVGLVLLIACANVANLFLVRAEGRQVEVAVRRAMGANSRSILWEHMSESLALALGGGVVGLGLAALGLKWLRFLGPEGLPRLQEIQIDGPVLGVTALLAVGAGILLGLAPALRHNPAGLTMTLREGGRGGSVGKERFQARNWLVVAQIALALVLLVGSGLLVRSFDALRKVEPGFVDPESLLTFRLSLPEAEIEEPEAVAATYELLAQTVEAIPGITSVGLSSSAPMDGWDSNDALHVEDFPSPEGQLPPIRRFKWISESYFETSGTPILAGRAITWADVRNRAPVMVMSENLARELWEEPSRALGKRVRPDSEGPWWEVVGVVEDVHEDGVHEDAVKIAYWPLASLRLDDEEGESTFVLRTMVFSLRSERLIGQELMADVRQAVWSINANLPLANVRTQAELFDRSMARTYFTLVMLGLAAGIAILLGFVGIFGVTSYSAAQRTREIGVRLALGAQRGDVRRLMLRHAMMLAIGGVVLGWIAAAVLTRAMSALLFGVGALDPVTYGVGTVLLVALVLLASYIPAWRAARLDPIRALRFE